MFCRSTTVDSSIDLNNVCGQQGMLFVQNGIGHAAQGIIATVAESHVESALDAIENVSPEFAAPIAFGLVPFDPASTATFFIPQFLVTKHEGEQCFATITGETLDDVSVDALNARIDAALNLPAPQASTNTFSVQPRMDVDEYLATVTKARDAVRSGELEKVVIARDIHIRAESPIDTHGVLQRLRASFGSSYRYCINNFIGASPELLVQREDRIIRSHPLAGTAPRTGDPNTDAQLAAELISSTKNQLEHRLVVDMVRDTLLPYCSYLDWEAEPSIVTVANVQHLGTAVEGALKGQVPSVMNFVHLLCPTPALGGHPSVDAIKFIHQNEKMERGFYGGAVGVLDHNGNGTFAVAIRCAEFSADKREARLFAGGGIVGESDPLSELAETQAKFQAMLSAIVRP